jgi:hypothetical protein
LQGHVFRAPQFQRHVKLSANMYIRFGPAVPPTWHAPSSPESTHETPRTVRRTNGLQAVVRLDQTPLGSLERFALQRLFQLFLFDRSPRPSNRASVTETVCYIYENTNARSSTEELSRTYPFGQSPTNELLQLR